MKKIIIALVGLVGILVIAYLLTALNPRTSPRPESRPVVSIAGKNITVDFVSTPEERTLGLSGRESLSENEGMLFYFDAPGKYGFWMKDMKFPIDIIWISQEEKIVYIKKDALPESYPENYVPNLDAKYVLEVNAGFSDKNNLKVGDAVKIMFLL